MVASHPPNLDECGGVIDSELCGLYRNRDTIAAGRKGQSDHFVRAFKPPYRNYNCRIGNSKKPTIHCKKDDLVGPRRPAYVSGGRR